MADKVKGKTTSGFAFEIDSNVFRDWLFLKAVRKMTSDGDESIDAVGDVIKTLFNDQNEEDRLIEFIAQKNDGRVPIDVIGKEVGEIMKIVQEKSKEAKN